MSEEDRIRKRQKNNESVRKCRENEKKKIENAREELKKLKLEYKELEEKYSSLQKELQLLKSLFQNSTLSTASALNINSENTVSTKNVVLDKTQTSKTSISDDLSTSNLPENTIVIQPNIILSLDNQSINSTINLIDTESVTSKITFPANNQKRKFDET